MALGSENLALTSDRAEIARRPLEPQQCALLVIDIQQKLLPPIFNKEQLIRNAQLLLRAAGILKIPALVSTQYAKGLGSTVPEIASLLPQNHTDALDKTEFSCFSSEIFCAALKQLPRSRGTLLLCGMETHICVAQTALAALREGYLVHVASDAVGSRTEWNWKIGLDRMRDAGAVISSTEMMIYELLRASSSAAFKELLPHLKD
jgi:nicotinamidase-related amidase